MIKLKYFRNFILDSAINILAWFAAFWFCVNLKLHEPAIYHLAYRFAVVAFVMHLLFSWYFTAYRMVWRYVSLSDLITLCKVTLCAAVSTIILLYFFHQSALFPHSIFPMYLLLSLGFLSTGRIIVRLFHEYSHHKSESNQRVLILGGGNAGEGLVRDYRRRAHAGQKVVGILDDQKSKIGMEIQGVRILAPFSEISGIVKEYEVDLVVIAAASLSGKKMRQIYDTCGSLNVPVRTLPSIEDISSGRVKVEELRPVSIDDLLSRVPNIPILRKIAGVVEGKSVMITGCGGSIGAELCRQIAAYRLKTLILCDHSEFALYTIHQELSEQFPSLKLIPLLVNIADKEMVLRAFKTYAPEIILHAAAYKHVPMLEHQSFNAVRNNILGTEHLLQAAVDFGVQRFILVSTDKAVNPTNVMGSTKRVCELLCQHYIENFDLKVTIVRFGNVLGSAGSVVPLFKKQLAAGGPITVTDPKMTRFFMTIPEAVNLILKATALGSGGELFILDMGEPVKITYLAEKLIELSGKRVGVDIDITYTGIRPGEKLYEELFYGDEDSSKKVDDKIYQATFPYQDARFMQAYQQLMQSLESGEKIKENLAAAIAQHGADNS